uniref:Uncharacterized protein n=1 Tax=Nicotiana tabacum TaxID=4097 RepID=A0A1S3ZFT1_TOBAC|nr:PREDICTED: uncharacterized protein LOC107786212 [Nicotiana tabacum]
MRNIKEAQFPRPLRSDTIQRDPNLWCGYHGTNRHRTRDCRHLHEEVATLLKNSHLREFLSDRAKNNYGRNWDNADPSKIAKMTKVLVTHSKRIREVAEDDITFIEEDVDVLLLPHNDALLISLSVLDFKIKRVLVDPESPANIFQWRVMEQAKIIGSIIPATKLLAGFNLASVTTRGRSCCLQMPKGS